MTLNMQTIYIVLIVVGVILLPTLLTWIQAAVSGVWLNPIQLLLMPLRRVPRRRVVSSLIEARQSGLRTIDRQKLEAHHMSGGDVENLVHALVAANKAGIELNFQEAAAIDLAGRDVLDAVRTSVNPKVIDTPPVEAVAKDGIQVIVKARVTIKSNVRTLVGGASEDTILARVGECIVTAIGAADSHENIMEKPDSISKLVMQRNLDSGTAYTIVSVDIADVDLGENVGAKLQIDRANADSEIAKAQAEKRRAMAVAAEAENRADQVKAEASVPRALATALEKGTMGYIDYYRLRNLQADTAMREQLGEGKSTATPVVDVNSGKRDFFDDLMG
ncbi:MAG: flotillin-like protein FloA [Bacteroidales bacterium]|nr:flotillin-like protein FloA [Bacteroidales bacterium]